MDKIIIFQLTGLDLNSLTGKRRTCKKKPTILVGALPKTFSNEKGEAKMLMKLTVRALLLDSWFLDSLLLD